jgi:hypothetical protein
VPVGAPVGCAAAPARSSGLGLGFQALHAELARDGDQAGHEVADLVLPTWAYPEDDDVEGLDFGQEA